MSPNKLDRVTAVAIGVPFNLRRTNRYRFNGWSAPLDTKTRNGHAILYPLGCRGGRLEATCEACAWRLYAIRSPSYPGPNMLTLGQRFEIGVCKRYNSRPRWAKFVNPRTETP